MHLLAVGRFPNMDVSDEVEDVVAVHISERGGSMVADVIAAVASIDPVMGGVDR